MPELLLLITAVIGTYLTSCLIWPYTRCPVCKGGKLARRDGEVWRKCWRCRGSGQRRRLGAALLGRG